MSKIRLFESRGLSEAERLAGLSLEMVTPLKRHGRWRRALPHVELLPVVIWITRGQGRVTVLGRTRGFGPATAIVVPPKTPFSIDPGAMTEGSLIRLPDMFEAPFSAVPRHLRLSDVSTQGELSGLVDRLERHGDLADPPTGRAAIGRIVLLSALLEREGGKIAPEKPTTQAKLAAKFARIVEDNLGRMASLEELAAWLGVTSTHLTRTLRDTCGMTAAAYMQARLMHEAQRRLADTDAPAGQIATDLGYSSAAYFTRAFGRETGLTPTAFRRNEARVSAA
ncbi:AraC family transcriptional regulator [Jannaschia pohangensis]|uniref:Transcriptional regulator, AraC family n=1 Tax=Jannaschia pohangensis TaxID=390807 RepID=A0A1I3GUU1_9RHOB|nr:AraC family transcriptional regulator [Jannaschia pohangensis]SFI27173.1 transcriptional regulator, AraC family [Jannaschia pohangensis]